MDLEIVEWIWKKSGNEVDRLLCVEDVPEELVWLSKLLYNCSESVEILEVDEEETFNCLPPFGVSSLDSDVTGDDSDS